jgi:glycine oxidase
MDDVLVIGGGAIGCASALALAKRGARVRLVECAHVGAEASSAAAGILGAYVEAHDTGPLTQLCFRSLAMYAGWTAMLADSTGIDVGHRPSGSMRVYADRDAFERESRAMHEALGDDAQPLDATEARALEVGLTATMAGALRFRKDCRIDPPALMRAVEGATRNAGVTITENDGVARILVEDGRATGVALESGAIVRAGAVVLTAGAWSPLEGSGLAPGWVEPIRGQMIELRMRSRPLDHVVFGPGAYLSPRDDGRVIVGSTQEHAGFHKAVTVRGVRGLLEGAAALVPAVEDAEISRMWSGLRPATPDGAPLLGPGAVPGLIVATGHFRNGILLAPITGEIVAVLVSGAPALVDLAPFAVDRFATGELGASR